MISARFSRLYLACFCLMALSPLQAEVYIEKRVNSWTQEGYLVVVFTMIVVFSLCLGSVYYEHKRKRK